MKPRPRVRRDPDDGAFGEAASLVAAGLVERDATADGFEHMPERDADMADTLLTAKVLRAFTRMVPVIACDPNDGSLHTTGEQARWAPFWFTITMETCRCTFGWIARSDAGFYTTPALRRRALAFVTRVLRDTALQQALTTLHRMGRDDLARDALHNEACGERDEADRP